MLKGLRTRIRDWLESLPIIQVNAKQVVYQGPDRNDCERCGQEGATQLMLTDSYPAYLCAPCRRDFQEFAMSMADYKAFCATKYLLTNQGLDMEERGELWGLAYDMQRAMGESVISWMKKKVD